MKIEKTVTVYQEKGFYSAFPGIANLGDGKIAVAFRRAPNYQGVAGSSGRLLQSRRCAQPVCDLLF